MPKGDGALSGFLSMLKAGAAPIALAALAGALAFSEYSRVVERVAMKRDIAEARADVETALASAIGPEPIHATEQSVYIVESPTMYGTAFVVDRERGILATAAHVVADLEKTKDKANLSAVNRETAAPLKIRALRIHEGYLSLTRLLDEYQPIERSSMLGSLQAVPIFDSAFDVGLIAVEPVTADGAPSLAPALKIADAETLRALKSGDPIATVSFPADATGTDSSVASRADRGLIAAMLEPIDYAGAPVAPDFTTVIAHRMTTKSGSSGAPILNREGDIIGVHISGGGSDGFAVRADAVTDMLDGIAGEAADIERQSARWRERLSRYVSANDAVPYAIYRIAAAGPAARAETLEAVDFTAGKPYSVKSAARTFGAVVEQFVVIDGLPADDLDEEAQRYARTLAVEQRTGFTFPFAAQFFVGPHKVAPGENHILYAFDYAAGLSGGYCTTGYYYRRAGETAFRAVGPARIAWTRLQPGDYQIVFFRPLSASGEACAETDDFKVGAVTWPADAPAAPTAASPAATMAGPAATAALATPTNPLVARLSADGRRAVHCLFSVGPGRWCPPDVSGAPLTAPSIEPRVEAAL